MSPHLILSSDTPTEAPGFKKQKVGSIPMGLKKLSSGGRPSKGPRHSFIVKLDIPRAEKLRDILEILDRDGVSHLSPMIADYVDSVNVDALRNQQALPLNQEALRIDKAS